MARTLTLDEAYDTPPIAPRRTIGLDDAYRVAPGMPGRGKGLMSPRPKLAAIPPPERQPAPPPSMLQRAVQSFPEAGRGLARGAQASVAESWLLVGNALMLVKKGLDAAGAPELMTKAAQIAQDYARSQQARTAPPDTPQSLAQKIYAGLGMAPAQVAEYGVASAALGPVAGFAAVDALRAADQGPGKAAEEAAKGALFGGVFHAASPLARGPRAAALGGTAATQTALEGGSPSDVVASGVAMGALGAAGGPGQVRLRDLPIRTPAAPPVELLLGKNVEERPLVLTDQMRQRDLPPPSPPRVRGTPNRATPPRIITLEDAYRPVAPETVPPPPVAQPKRMRKKKVVTVEEAYQTPPLTPAPPAPIERREPVGEMIPAPPGGRFLGKSVPFSPEALEGKLSRGAERRFEPTPDKARKAEALRLQSATKEQLDAIEKEIADSPYQRLHEAARAAAMHPHGWTLATRVNKTETYRKDFIKGASGEPIPEAKGSTYASSDMKQAMELGREWAEEQGVFGKIDSARKTFTLRAASGRDTQFEIEPTLEAAQHLRRQLFGPESERLFYSQTGPQAMQPPGANWVGLTAETYGAVDTGIGKASPVARRDLLGRPKPLTREEILAPLVKALGTSLYQGRVKKVLKRAVGFYRPKIGEVRIEAKGDIEVAAHELAHLLDDRNPEIRASWLRGPGSRELAKELAGVSYDKSKVNEGFAEFVRLWMTQKDEAKSRAPKFYDWFESFADRSPQGSALRQAQEQMHRYFAQDPLLRAKSKIGQNREINEHLDGAVDRFRQSVFDDLHGILRMERELTGEVKVGGGAYTTARLTRAAMSITSGALDLGRLVLRPDGSHAFEGKGLRQILGPVARDLYNWILYAVGRSAAELKSQGRERLFTGAEIVAMRNLETPAFRKAFEEYQDWNRAIVDFAQAKGLIDPNMRALWRRQWYLPFHRVGSEGQGAKRVGGIEGNVKATFRLTGGTGNLRDILDNMVQNAGHLIAEALKNEARREVALLSRVVPGGGKFLAEIPAETRGVKIDQEQVLAELRRAGIIDKGPDGNWYYPDGTPVEIDALAPFMTFWMFKQAPRPKSDENIIAVLFSGQPRYFQVNDPILFRSLEALNRKGKNWLVRFLGGVRRVGQASITLTPDFMVANLARDTVMAGIMSRAGFRPFLDSAAGMVSRLRKDQSYKDFIANGGGLASHLLDEGGFRRHLERFYSNKGIDYRTVLDAPDKLLAGLEAIADAFEVATRIGEYKRAVARDVPPRGAAYLAREVSTDFAMRGDSEVIGFFFDTVIFLKAAANSMDRLYRGATQDPNRVKIWALTASLAAASAALAAYNLQNHPEYDALEDWDKDTHWHFFLPLPDGETLHLRYPKIWEFGAIGSIAERSVDAVRKEKPGALPGQIWSILSDLFGVEVIPQAVQPLYEVAKNQQTFTGRRIVPMGEEGKEPWLRTRSTTSEFSRRVGEMTRNLPPKAQIPPAVLDHLIRGYFGTWGLYGLMAADAAAGQGPALAPDQFPVLRRFYSQMPPRRTKYEEMFFDMVQAAEQAHRSMKAVEQEHPRFADEFEQSRMNRLLGYRGLEHAKRQEQAIRREMDAVRRDSALSPGERRQRLDALTQERNAFLKSAVEARQ